MHDYKSKFFKDSKNYSSSGHGEKKLPMKLIRSTNGFMASLSLKGRLKKGFIKFLIRFRRSQAGSFIRKKGNCFLPCEECVFDGGLVLVFPRFQGDLVVGLNENEQ